jgi:glyoxylase-like metal-dependent hydrolase (beta-lactamase superfamily II)
MSTKRPLVQSFLDVPSNTFTYLITDPSSKRSVIIDSVLDYDPASACTSTRHADGILQHIQHQGYHVDYILDTQ